MLAANYIKIIPTIMFLGLANFCEGQLENNIEPSDLTLKTFQNYLLKKDSEELSLNCLKDTIINSKDSISILYRRTNRTIFKSAKLYFHTGYIVKVKEEKDSINFGDLIKDTKVLERADFKYYDNLGNIIFGKSKNFVRSSRWDFPCYGCYTIYLTDTPDEWYERLIYNSSNKPLVKIYYLNSGDDFGYKRVKYFYDSKGKNIDKKEEKININQFWKD